MYVRENSKQSPKKMYHSTSGHTIIFKKMKVHISQCFYLIVLVEKTFERVRPNELLLTNKKGQDELTVSVYSRMLQTCSTAGQSEQTVLTYRINLQGTDVKFRI